MNRQEEALFLELKIQVKEEKRKKRKRGNPFLKKGEKGRGGEKGKRNRKKGDFLGRRKPLGNGGNMGGIQHLGRINSSSNSKTMRTIRTEGQAENTTSRGFVSVQERRLIRDIPELDGFVSGSGGEVTREGGVEGQSGDFFVVGFDSVEVLE